MKITKEQLAELFTKLDLQDAQLVETKEEADEFNPESIIDGFLNSKQDVFRQKFETDILPEKIKEVAGKFGGNLKNYIRKASDNVIKTSDLEGKTDEEAILILKEYLYKSKDATTEEVRNQMQELISKHQEELNSTKYDYETRINEQLSKFEDINISSSLSEIIKSIPLLGEDDNVKIDTLKHAIRSKFTPKWNEEKKALELREKDNPEKLALNGNSLIDAKAFAQEYFSSLGMVKKDTSNENATNHLNNGGLVAPRDNDFHNPSAGLPFAGLVDNMV